MQAKDIKSMVDLIIYLKEGGVDFQVTEQGMYVGTETDESTFFIKFSETKPSIRINGSYLRTKDIYVIEGLLTYIDCVSKRDNTQEELFKELSRDNKVEVLSNGNWDINDSDVIVIFRQNKIIYNVFGAMFGKPVSEEMARIVIRLNEYFAANKEA